MAGNLGYEVGILEFLVEIPDKNTTGHMGAGNFPDGVLLFFSGKGVDDRYFPVYSGKPQHLLDVVIVFLGTDEGKEAVSFNVRIALQNLQCSRAQWNPDRDRSPFLGFPGDIFDGSVYHVALFHLEKVANPATDKAVKDEDVTLDFKPRIIRELRRIQKVPFLLCNVEWCPVHRLSDLIFLERFVGG